MKKKNKLNVNVSLSSHSVQPWSSPTASLSLTNPHALTPVNHLSGNRKKGGDSGDGRLNTESETETFDYKVDKKGVISRFFPKRKIKKLQQYSPYCNSSSQEESVSQQEQRKQEMKDGFHRLKNPSSLSSPGSNASDMENDANSMMQKTKLKLKAMKKAIKPHHSNSTEKTNLSMKSELSNTDNENVNAFFDTGNMNPSSLSSPNLSSTNMDNDTNPMMRKTKIKLKSMTKAIKPHHRNFSGKKKLSTKSDKSNTENEEEVNAFFESRNINTSSLSSSNSSPTNMDNDANPMMRKTKIKLKSMTNSNTTGKTNLSTKNELHNIADKREGNKYSEEKNQKVTCNALRISDTKSSSSTISFDMGKDIPINRKKHRIVRSQCTLSTNTTESTTTLNSTFSEPENENIVGMCTKIAGLGSMELQSNSTLQTFDENDSSASRVMDEDLDLFRACCGQPDLEVIPSASSQPALDTLGAWTSDEFALNAAMKTRKTSSSIRKPNNQAHLVNKFSTISEQASNVETHEKLLNEKIEKANESNKLNIKSTSMEERQINTQILVLTRSALSRPFGRTGLPAHLAKQWQVEVSPIDFDEKSWMWRYNVVVQKEEYGGLSIINGNVDNNNNKDFEKNRTIGDCFFREEGENTDELPSTLTPSQKLLDVQGISLSSSVAAANVTRTLEDFVWLEQAMKEEYHGALVLPLLSLAMTDGGSSLDWTTSELMNKDEFLRGEWDPLVISANFMDGHLKDGGNERNSTESFAEKRCESFKNLDSVESDANSLEKEVKFPAQVNYKALGDWLSDVINCVRGKGELIIQYGGIDVMHSDAMEMFLYSSQPLPKPITNSYQTMRLNDTHTPPKIGFCLGSNMQTTKEIDFTNETAAGDITKKSAIKFSSFPQFLSNQFTCANPADICLMMDKGHDIPAPPFPAELGPDVRADFILSRRSEVYTKLHPKRKWTNPILRRHSHPTSVPQSQSSRQIQTQRQLQDQSQVFVLLRLATANQRECTLRAMYRLRILLDQETLVGGAWRRFAICLSNLYSYEKDIESCKIRDLVKGKKLSSSSSQRKADKNIIDEALRKVARQKMDRTIPSLKVLSVMLSAYFSDLSSVDSSLCEYADALRKVRELEQKERDGDVESNNNFDVGWKSQYLNSISNLLSPSKRSTIEAGQVKEIAGRCSDFNEYDNGQALSIEDKMLRQRVISLEPIMKSSLLQLCNSTDLRASRMAWKFFKMESGQATLLRSAATKLRTKLESISKNDEQANNECKKNTGNDDKHALIQENDIEKPGEGEKELDLVRKIFDLEKQDKQNIDDDTEAESKTSEDIKLGDCNDTTATEALMDKALEYANKRSGRWDQELALMIMEALSVENAEILLEETKRDLRQVQKLADSLRQNINRCTEAIEMLKKVVIGNDCKGGQTIASTHVTKLREKFMASLSVVFSGTYNRLDDETDVTDELHWEEDLSKMGINTDDDAGWLQTRNTCKKNEFNVHVQLGRCGDAAIQYQRVREKETQNIVNNLLVVLDNYEHRIQNIESFVYMQCIGVQIEKHFSKRRVEALAAWDRKTDISSAINIAKRKRLPLIVQELESKMSNIKHVSRTFVKEAKERHLSSKVLKEELEALAFRRFQLLKDDATNRVVELINIWSHYEETVADMEVKRLTETIKEIERHVSTHKDIIKADGGAHLYALCGGVSNNGSVLHTPKPSTTDNAPVTADKPIEEPQKKTSMMKTSRKVKTRKTRAA